MKYNISLNQPKMIEFNLSVNQWCILDVISVAPAWCDPVLKDNEVYYWMARQKIAEELKSLNLKPDTIYRHVKNLVSLNFLEYEKSGKKDLIRLSKKGKKLFSTMSEMNPNPYVGNESENTMSEMNPTYNNTSNIKGFSLLSSFKKEYLYTGKIKANVDDEVLLDFISYRKQIKSTILTTKPIALFLNALVECKNYGYEEDEAIDIMKSREWKTLKLDWLKKEYKPKSAEPEFYYE